MANRTEKSDAATGTAEASFYECLQVFPGQISDDSSRKNNLLFKADFS